jgi:hypothetical protein
MQEPAPPGPVEGAYRCTECGHGEKLWAYVGCAACGPLSPDGEGVEEYEWIDDWGIYEDSICCAVHGNVTLERFVGGKWSRWWSCPKCGGGGVVVIKSAGAYGRDYRYACEEETPFPVRPISLGDPGTVHEGWLPLEEFAVAGDG